MKRKSSVRLGQENEKQLTQSLKDTNRLSPTPNTIFFLLVRPIKRDPWGRTRRKKIVLGVGDRENYPWTIECFLEDLFLGGQSSIKVFSVFWCPLIGR